jgi:hypothetical protein
MRIQQVTESIATRIALSDADVELLRRLGQQLASKSAWWGARDDDDESPSEKSVISLEPTHDREYRVTVLNMIGVLRLATVQLQVVPKIPLPHFLHLIHRSELAPRTATADVHVQPSTAFIEVLARWCVAEAEDLLRHGLRPEYNEFLDEQSTVRGQVRPCETMFRVLRGQPIAVCEFDELTEDAPLNRLVRGACERLSKMDLLAMTTRAKARAVVYRMDGIGQVQPADMQVPVDRLSRRYARAVALARLVLGRLGVSLAAGPYTGTAFLLRTPDLVESGLRATVAAALDGVSVTTGRIMLGSTGLSMNPDLVFDRGMAVGDIKYKYLGGQWRRSDLYQSIAFATAYRCKDSLVIGFSTGGHSQLPPLVTAGEVRSTALAWSVDPGQTPERSEEDLRFAVAAWYESNVTPSQPRSSRQYDPTVGALPAISGLAQ